VYTCPIPSKGLSTVFAPIHVKISTVEVKNQNLAFFNMLNFIDFPFFGINTIKITIDATSAITPPNFDGIERSTT